MLYDSATNQNLCMSSEIKRPAPSEHLLANQDLGSSRSRQDDQVDLLLQRKKRNEGAARPWALLSKCTFRWLTWDSTDARRQRMAWALDIMEEIRSQPPTENGCVWNALHPKKKRCSIITAWRLPSLLPFWDTRSNSDPHRKDNEFRGLNSWVLYPAALRPRFSCARSALGMAPQQCGPHVGEHRQSFADLRFDKFWCQQWFFARGLN